MIPSVYLGDHTALVRTVFGGKMFVDTRDTILAPHLLLNGDWEHWIRSFLQRTLMPGMRFVDVGAQVGWYTLLAWQLVGQSGWVEAFEPVPRHAQLLRQSLQINGCPIRVSTAAASNARGVLPFSWEYGNGRVGEEPEGDAEPIEVECVRLDEHFEAVDFVKIDAERHEPQVLEGMSGLFERCPKIQVLVEHHSPSAFPATFLKEHKILSSLVASGFKLGIVEHDGMLSEVAAIDDLEEVPDSEMLFLARP